MVRAISAFMEFCYLARRSIIDKDTLTAIDEALASFHRNREIFRTVRVRPYGFSLPRQHSLAHFRCLIQMFGTPNGLCSSITESKHIKAVKKPWRRSSRHRALGQMLLTNQRLDKLAAARLQFTARGMMQGHGLPLPPLDPPLPPIPEEDDNADQGPVNGAMCLGEVKLSKYPGMSNIANNYRRYSMTCSTSLPKGCRCPGCSHRTKGSSGSNSTIFIRPTKPEFPHSWRGHGSQRVPSLLGTGTHLSLSRCHLPCTK